MKYKNFAITYEAGVEEMSLELIEQGMFDKVRLMPDTHIGKGSAVGFTAPVGNVLHPNVVGVDIGCGMSVAKLTTKETIDFEALDTFIKNNIGHGDYKTSTMMVSTKELLFQFCDMDILKKDLLALKMQLSAAELDYAMLQIGSLGGGNHFIELNKDDEGSIYIVVHSGSRNLGVKVCTHYVHEITKQYDIERVEERNKRIETLKLERRHREIEQVIKDFDKMYQKDAPIGLVEKALEDYLHDMKIAQKYASQSRQLMIHFICHHLGFSHEPIWESVHNYIDFNDMIVRKGATPAHKGQKVIIPINMAEGSILATGLGNEDWNYSAPHGAGRLLSRTKAKQQLDLNEALEKMSENGVYSTTLTESTLDEAPKSYKDINEIITAIDGITVRDIKRLRSIYNFKG